MRAGASLSPDGTQVAFTADYEGNADVYVLPVEGGLPRRLTWHPDRDRVPGLAPRRDARGLREPAPERSAHGQGLPRPRRGRPRRRCRCPRWRTSPSTRPAGGCARGLHAAAPAPSAPGSATAADASRRCGSTDLETLETQQAPHVKATDAFPCFAAGSVWFASDRGSGGMNALALTSPRALDTGQAEATQVTRFNGLRRARRSRPAAACWCSSRRARSTCSIPPRARPSASRIRVRHDGLSALPRWQDVKGHVREMAVAPNGQRAVFEARGEILTLPRDDGDARNLTRAPARHDRDPVWSPDGTQVAWFTDAGGEYRARRAATTGAGEPEAPTTSRARASTFDPVWSPDGKHVLYQRRDRAGCASSRSRRAPSPRWRASWAASACIRPVACWSPRRTLDRLRDAEPRHRLRPHRALRGRDGQDDRRRSPTPSAIGRGAGLLARRQAPLLQGHGRQRPAALRARHVGERGRGPPPRASTSPCSPRTEKNPLAPARRATRPTGKPSPQGRPGKDGGEEKPGPRKDDGKEDEGGARDKESESEKARSPRPRQARSPCAGRQIDVEGLDQRILALPLPRRRPTARLAARRTGCSSSKPADESGPDPQGLHLEDAQGRGGRTRRPGLRGERRRASAAHARQGRLDLMDHAGKDKKRVSRRGAKVRVEPDARVAPDAARGLAPAARLLLRPAAARRGLAGDVGRAGAVPRPRAPPRGPEPRDRRADRRAGLRPPVRERRRAARGPGRRAARASSAPTSRCERGASASRAISTARTGTRALRAPLDRARRGRARGRRPRGRERQARDGRRRTCFASSRPPPTRQVELTLDAPGRGGPTRKVTVVPVASDRELRRRAWIEEHRAHRDAALGRTPRLRLHARHRRTRAGRLRPRLLQPGGPRGARARRALQRRRQGGRLRDRHPLARRAVLVDDARRLGRPHALRRRCRARR